MVPRTVAAAISAAIATFQVGVAGGHPILGDRIEVKSLTLVARPGMEGLYPGGHRIFGITLKLAVLLVFWYVGRHGSAP